MGRMSKSDFYYGSILNEILQNNPKSTPTLISYEKDKRQVYKIYSEEIKKEYFLFFKYANMKKVKDEKEYRSWSFTFSDDDKRKLDEYHKKQTPIFLCLLCIGLELTQSKIAILEYSEYKQVKNKSSITISLEAGKHSFGLFPGEGRARQKTIKINTNRIDQGFEVLLNSYFQKNNVENKIIKPAVSLNKKNMVKLDQKNISKNTRNIFEELNIDIQNGIDFRNSIQDLDYEKSCILYEKISTCQSRQQNIIYWKYLFSSFDSKYYEILIRIACRYLKGKMIYDIFVVQDDEVKSNIKSKLNFQEILNDLEKTKEVYKFGIIAYILKRTDLFDYLTDYEKKEALVAINTEESKKLLLGITVGENDLINIISKLEMEDDNFVEDVCIKAIAENNDEKEMAVDILVNKGNNKPLPLKKIIDLAIKMGGQDFNIIKKLIKYCTKYEYRLKKIKNNAQGQNKKDYLKLIKEMNKNNLSSSQIIYLYMNTKLRTEIFIDQLIYEMINIGYRKSEIIDNLREYRILGEIKHVNNDIVTVVAKSVISSRLMIFRKDENIIIGSKCKINPSKGKVIYFNIQDYLNKGLMYIDNIYEL